MPEFERFLDAVVPQLEAMGAAMRWSDAVRVAGAGQFLHMVHPLGVVPKSAPGKYRLIFDLRRLNAYLRECPFEYQTLRRSRSLFRRGDWLFSFDLSSAYHHVGLRPAEWRFYGFC